LFIHNILTAKDFFFSLAIHFFKPFFKDQLIFDQLEVDEREWCASCEGGFGKPPMKTFEVETDGQNIQHPAVLNAFAGNILRGEKLVADGREGINGLTLANAMFLSSWTNAPVVLPLDEKKFYDMLMERCKTSRHKEETGKTFSTEGSY